MESGTDHERFENHVHAYGAPRVLGQHFFLSFALRKLSDAFGLTVSKSWYLHYFNTRANLDYVGKFPEVSYYVVDEISASER